MSEFYLVQRLIITAKATRRRTGSKTAVWFSLRRASCQLLS